MGKTAVDALLEGADDIPAVAPAAAAEFKPPLPKTKGEVGKLSADQMDALVEAHELGMPGEWSDASAAEKHKILNVVLGFTASKKKKGEAVALVAAEVVDDPPFEDGKPIVMHVDLAADEDDSKLPEPLKNKKTVKEAVPLEADDPISLVAQEIEGLKDQVAIEGEITTLLTSEGMNDFKLGGLMLRLLEVGTFGDNSTFKDYIGQRWGLKYRKARYLIELYNGLLKSGIAWESVAGIGWSKVITLLPVLTKENVAEWVEKAKQYNNDTLQATVKAALAGDGNANPNDAKLEQSKLKTLTFGVGPDQEELIKEAVEHAMSVGQTEHKGVALELICTEYLGNTTAKTAAPKKAAPQLVSGPDPEGKYIQESVVQQMMKYVLQPKNFFQHYLKQSGGDIAGAMGLMFGDDFDAVFPNVTLSIDIG